MRFVLIPLLACMMMDHGDSTATKYVDVVVGKAVDKCTENRCIEDGGCAKCALLEIALRPGEQVVAIRYYTTASDPKDKELHQVSPGDLPSSSMPAAVQRSTSQNVVVMTTYYNRSPDQERKAAMEIDYK